MTYQARSWSEIKTRVNALSKEWEAETREDAEAKSFWDAYFNVFGITRRCITSFEGRYRSWMVRVALLQDTKHKSSSRNPFDKPRERGI